MMNFALATVINASHRLYLAPFYYLQSPLGILQKPLILPIIVKCVLKMCIAHSHKNLVGSQNIFSYI